MILNHTLTTKQEILEFLNHISIVPRRDAEDDILYLLYKEKTPGFIPTIKDVIELVLEIKRVLDSTDDRYTTVFSTHRGILELSRTNNLLSLYYNFSENI